MLAFIGVGCRGNIDHSRPSSITNNHAVHASEWDGERGLPDYPIRGDWWDTTLYVVGLSCIAQWIGLQPTWTRNHQRNPLNASPVPTTYTFTVMDSTVPTAQLSTLTRTLTINAALTIDVAYRPVPHFPLGLSASHTTRYCRRQEQRAQEPTPGRLLEICSRLQVCSR